MKSRDYWLVKPIITEKMISSTWKDFRNLKGGSLKKGVDPFINMDEP